MPVASNSISPKTFWSLRLITATVYHIYHARKLKSYDIVVTSKLDVHETVTTNKIYEPN